MKKAILILSAIILTSCSIETDEVGQKESLTEVFKNQMPVLDKMCGDFTDKEGYKLFVNTQYVYSIEFNTIKLSEASVLLSQDCFIDIYLSDGTHIRIVYFWQSETVHIIINGELVNVYYKNTPAQEPEQPINNM